MSNDYKRHHFIPKSYLKEFGVGNGNNLKVFTQKISLKHFDARPINVGNAIGQIENFYRLQTNDSFIASQFGDDPNIIEKKGFSYETHLHNLFNRLKEKNVKQILLNHIQTYTIIDALINIKFRNPFMRETYKLSKPLFEAIVPKLKEDLLNQIEEEKNKVADEDKELSEVLLEELKRKLEFDFENHDELVKTIHSAGIHLPDSTMRTHMNHLGTIMLNSRWNIIQTHPGKQFITSDNPGVFLSNDGNVYSLIFDIANHKIERFFFPLSPLHGLLIDFREPDAYGGHSKQLQCVYSPKSVFEYNVCHCCHANDILIASSKIALEETFQKGRKAWIDVRTRK